MARNRHIHHPAPPNTLLAAARCLRPAAPTARCACGDPQLPFTHNPPACPPPFPHTHTLCLQRQDACVQQRRLHAAPVATLSSPSRTIRLPAPPLPTQTHTLLAAARCLRPAAPTARCACGTLQVGSAPRCCAATCAACKTWPSLRMVRGSQALRTTRRRACGTWTRASAWQR
eukprot:364870-Chlamydomonas_euryale.AAC.18